MVPDVGQEVTAYFRLVDPLVGGPGRLSMMGLNWTMTYAAKVAKERGRRMLVRIDQKRS